MSWLLHSSISLLPIFDAFFIAPVCECKSYLATSLHSRGGKGESNMHTGTSCQDITCISETNVHCLNFLEPHFIYLFIFSSCY